jgi:hypothetical protein
MGQLLALVSRSDDVLYSAATCVGCLSTLSVRPSKKKIVIDAVVDFSRGKSEKSVSHGTKCERHLNLLFNTWGLLLWSFKKRAFHHILQNTGSSQIFPIKLGLPRAGWERMDS